MTGFNPAFSVSAEEIEAQSRQDDGAADEAAAPEGTGEESPKVDDGDAASTAAGTRDVTLDGRTFKAPKDIADAFTREINRRDGTRGAELQQLRERLARLEGQLAARPKDDEGADQGPPIPDPDLQIEDPKKHQEMILTRVRWEQQQLVEAKAAGFEKDLAAQNQEKERVSNWNTHVEKFYAKDENKVLRENRDIVDMVLAKHREELAPLSVEEGFQRLGELARDRVAQVTGQAPEIRARRTPKPPVLEGSARRGAVEAPAKKDEGPKSLSEAVNARRAAAKQSFLRGTQPATTSR
jgi:BMFP domain-containing protein YqiC